MMENIIEKNDDDVPSVLNSTVPKLVSINTKLFLLLVILVVVVLLQGYWINLANKRAETNTELMFMKMYPNGTWDVEYRKSGNESDFFPLTIDKLLQDYVEARYAVEPNVKYMRRNYGYALVFMAPQLAENFVGVGKDQFNAPQKAIDIGEGKITEEIKIRFVDHFDVASGVFVKGNSELYRTNVFIERKAFNSMGQLEGDPVNEVVNLHWRIKSIDELRNLTREQLRANPIGLEIIKDKINLDKTAKY